MKNLNAFIIICVSVLSFAHAQNVRTVTFNQSQFTVDSSLNESLINEWPGYSTYENRITGWMVFDELPSLTTHQDLASEGIKLSYYIENGIYAFHAPQNISTTTLSKLGVQAIVPMDNQRKTDKNLWIESDQVWEHSSDRIELMVMMWDFIKAESFLEAFKRNEIDIIAYDEKAHIAQVGLKKSGLKKLQELGFVYFIENTPAPSVKEDTDGRGLHKSSNLDTQTTAGRNYTGAGIGVLVRDDGIVGPHIDFKGRIDNSYASGSGQTHGDGVAGIMAGAGNLDPDNRGMAAGSNVYVSNYTSSFLDNATTDLIANGEVQITNSSYGNGCNDGYTSIAQYLDQQSITDPTVLHVFSAGNSNGNNCGYGAGNQWGNITGGHKQGKSVIATANVFDTATLASSSSKGPASDGRIKPDITAHGQGHMSTDEDNSYRSFGGTSGAAPGVAGVAAQLYQSYRDKNGTLPESGFIKGVLLNTANDYGNTGPDFSYGWGIVNGLRAVQVIEDDRFYSGNATQGSMQTQNITVPSGVHQLKIMLYWTDPAATPGAVKSLVNDLDLRVIAPDGSIIQPWILDPTPNPATLGAPATRGVDRLNNMEQVQIDTPIAGTYTIEVNGFSIPMGTQDYFVNYDMIQTPFEITYPIGGESFVPGTTEFIQWDATSNTSGTAQLEFSTNNGTTWNPIATVQANQKLYEWNVPGSISGECLVRLSNATHSSSSSNTFNLAFKVNNITINRVCPTGIDITWPIVPAATSYDIYVLGDKFMEVVGSSNTTSFTVPITDYNVATWIAIQAKGANWTGKRSIAVGHDGSGLINCPLNADISVNTINNTPSDFQQVCGTSPIIISTTIENTGLQAQSNFEMEYQVGTNPPVVEIYNGTLNPGDVLTYTFNTPYNLNVNGNQTLVVRSGLNNDENIVNDEVSLEFFGELSGSPLDYSENFEGNGFLPEGWLLFNPDGGTTWVEVDNVTGSDGNPTTTTFINSANYSSRGAIDWFETSYIDLNTSSSNPIVLVFDLAKAQWSSTYNDKLHIDISTDCGATYTRIYSKEGLNLATVGYTNSNWSPSSANDWRQESVDLTSYAGNNIKIRFISENDYSNSTFIDNIQVNTTLSTATIDVSNQVMIYPNPATSFTTLELSEVMDIKNASMTIYNQLGQIMVEQPIMSNVMKVNTVNCASGMYFIEIQTSKGRAIKKLIIN